MTNRELEELCQGAPPDATTTTDGPFAARVLELRRLRTMHRDDCDCAICIAVALADRLRASRPSSEPGRPDPAYNEEMIGLIRAITDANGAEGVPFLDDAVKVAIEKARSPGSGEEEGLRARVEATEEERDENERRLLVAKDRRESAEAQARRIFGVLTLKEAILSATESDLRAAHEGDLHILKRRCTVCGEDFYTPHAEHDICRKHAYVGPRTALSGRADGKGTT